MSQNYFAVDSFIDGAAVDGVTVIVARAKVDPESSCLRRFWQASAMCPLTPQIKHKPFLMRRSHSSGRSLPSGPRSFLYAASFFLVEPEASLELEGVEVEGLAVDKSFLRFSAFEES